MKHTAARLLTSLLLVGGLLTTSAAPAEAVVPPTRFTSLEGMPLTGVTAPGSHLGYGANGEPLLYYVSSGSTAYFSAVDARTGQRVFEAPMPGAGGSWIVDVGPNGEVYSGAYGNGSLFRWIPGQPTIENLGQAVPGETFIWSLDITEDGTVFGGTGQVGGHLFSWDPDAKSFTDYGPNSIGEPLLIHGTAIAPNGQVYGLEGLRPGLVRLDPTTRQYTRMTLPTGADPTVTGYDLDVRGNLMFARFGDKPSSLHVMDLTTEEWIDAIPGVHGLRMSEVSPDGRSTYFVKEQQLYRYDLQDRTYTATGVTGLKDMRAFGFLRLGLPDFPGETLIGSDYEGNVLRYDPATGKSETMRADAVGAPAPIRSIAEGPDGKVYAGSYLNGGLASYDPRTGEKVAFAPEVGQAEGMTTHAGALYVGTYPGADIWRFDPSEPAVTGVNPRRVLRLRELEQSRPYAMVSAGQYLAIGTVPSNGKFGGGLTLLDTETGEYHFEEVVQDHSIVGLGYHDGILYGSTSVYGGVGADRPTEKDGYVFAYDIEQRKVLWQVKPVPGEGSFGAPILDQSGHLWVHSPATLVNMDPATGAVLATKTFEVNYPWDTIAYAHGGGVLWMDPYYRDLTVVNQAAMWIINEETLTRARYVRPTSHGFLHSSGSAYFARDLAFQRMDFLDGRPTATVTVVEDGNGGRVAQLRGFGAHEPLDVWLRPKPVELGVVTADADGSVDVPFSGPLPRGDYEVTASRPMTRGQIGGGTFTIDDSVAPTTKAAVVGARGRPADVSVTLTTTDAGDSGLARTEYRVDAGAWTTYSQPITFATGGSFTVAYRSIDGAGNVEATQSVVVPVRWDKGCGDHGENEKGNGGRPGCGNVPGQPNAGKP